MRFRPPTKNAFLTKWTAQAHAVDASIMYVVQELRHVAVLYVCPTYNETVSLRKQSFC